MSVGDAAQPNEAAPNVPPQIGQGHDAEHPARDQHPSTFVSNDSVYIDDIEMYQIQANHFLANHFGELAMNPRNLEKLLVHKEWLQKQLQVTQAVISKMGANLMQENKPPQISYDRDMFREAKNIIQREQNKL